jgi:hypothetical protein
MRISSTILIGIFALSRVAGAQQTCSDNSVPVTCTLPVSASATVNSVARLSISVGTTTLTTPKSTDFGTTGGVNSTGPTITVTANTGYTLTASAGGSTWTFVPAAGVSATSKPAGDLKMSVNSGTLTALGQVAHTSTHSAAAGDAYTIGYNTIYNWAVDKPGSYSLIVTYTLSAP